MGILVGDPTNLKRLGITVAPHRIGAGGFIVRGDTFPHRQRLHELGGKWDRMTQAWLFEGDEDPSPKLAEALEGGGRHRSGRSATLLGSPAAAARAGARWRAGGAARL
ncbi:MAG: hypothetical protein WD711_08800 [Dongiaceae bacterium]